MLLKADTDELNDSDADQTTGFTICTTLDPGEWDKSWDAGLIEVKPNTGLISIGDFVWNDLDRDGLQDIDEPGIIDVKVELYGYYKPKIKLAETATDIKGKYHFDNLPTGKYRIKFIAPEGWTFTYENRGKNDSEDSDVQKDGLTKHINYTAGIEDLTWDAGLYELMVRPRGYGYWKTHFYNPVWTPIGEKEFFYSGQTWFKVIKTEPRKGNAYYILAHQYIAARLNELAGSYVPTNIIDAMLKATKLFEYSRNTPIFIGNLKGNDQLRKEFLKLSELLNKYNDGKFDRGSYGWGHHDWD